ncbi:hypothetical protein LJC71_10235 [Desulfosarcina sp. OttesenSCG-928-A07]|nr:hypothetical protein [Desulfosarcina sp. OttesenSCG-928-G17]MDL2330098.1 hypothetical protein [Desulfosarcina sp. OttesenSCG-928-A07]
MHAPHTVREDLADFLEKALIQSGQLTPAVLDYIEKTLFPPTPDPLKQFLVSDDNARDSLLLLIFSPDEAARIHVEHILGKTPCTPADEAALKAFLLGKKISVPIVLPEEEILLYLDLPDFIISRYVDQLRLSWQIPPAMELAINAAVASAMVPLVRVRIKQANPPLMPFQQAVLCRFFDQVPDKDPEFLKFLDIVLSIPEPSDTAPLSIHERLMRKKQVLLMQLQKNRRFEHLLRNSSMEVLMAQGVRGISIGSDELLVQMRRIDRLCWTMTGKSLPQGLVVESPALDITDISDITAILRDFI